MGFKLGPIIIGTLIQHFLRRELATKDSKAREELLYDEAFIIVKVSAYGYPECLNALLNDLFALFRHLWRPQPSRFAPPAAAVFDAKLTTYASEDTLSRNSSHLAIHEYQLLHGSEQFG